MRELVTALIARKPPGGKLALAFINLDDFKRVNDLHGHAAGDALLREVTARVQSQIRQADVFGRINGDEFVIALDPVGQSPDVAQVIERIRARLQQPLTCMARRSNPRHRSAWPCFGPRRGLRNLCGATPTWP